MPPTDLKAIIEATNKVLLEGGPSGFILNVGHGVVQVSGELKVQSPCTFLTHNCAILIPVLGYS